MLERFALAAALAFGVSACGSMGDRGSEHPGSTSVAPAVTGANSSTTTKGPPGSGSAPNPPTDQSTTPK